MTTEHHQEVTDYYHLQGISEHDRKKIRAVQKKVRCLNNLGFHDLAYVEWTNVEKSSGRTLLLVHGLARSSRDWDGLAQYLALHLGYRCLCVDVVGRGLSDKLPDPAGYGYVQYMFDINTVLAATIGPKDQIDYIGSSMGGLIGIFLTSKIHNPFRKFIINDAGAVIQKVDIERIASYFGMDPKWETVEEAVEYNKKIYNQFKLTDDQYAHITKHTIEPIEVEGKKMFHYIYDPKIAVNFKLPMTTGEGFKDVVLWDEWNKVNVKEIMIIRGQHSALLSSETVAKMRQHPQVTKVAEFDCGHCPMFFTLDQIQEVAQFLEKN